MKGGQGLGGAQNMAMVPNMPGFKPNILSALFGGGFEGIMQAMQQHDAMMRGRSQGLMPQEPLLAPTPQLAPVSPAMGLLQPRMMINRGRDSAMGRGRGGGFGGGQGPSTGPGSGGSRSGMF